MLAKNSRMLLREGLMRLFDGLSEERIINVCAPAGYGKTVAVRQWLSQSECTSIIIALDEYDDDPARFCSRLCSVLRRCYPENATLREIASHLSFRDAPVEFALHAIDALPKGENTKLFIDDLHVIHDKRTLRLLIRLLERLPENFQAVLASRIEPSAELSALWTNKIPPACVTADNLRFSREELISLYDSCGISLAAAQADDIYRFTNGWAIGIGAVLLSGDDLGGENLVFLDEFIESNVWQRWDEETREFMLQTSVIHELIPSLCNKLTVRRDSEILLSDLMHKSAFISQTELGVYRYHHLFHDFLRRILAQRGEKFSDALLHKAGHWYLDEADFYSAAECFLQCGNHDGVSQCFMLLINSGHRNYIPEKLLPILNSSMLNAVAERNPYIYSLLSWASFNQGRTEDLIYYSDRYYEISPELIRDDPRLALNVMYVKMTDFRISMHEMMAQLKELHGITTKQSVALDIQPGIINQNMPFMHRGTRDLSEFASETDVLKTVKHERVLDIVFGDLTGLVLECVASGLLYERGQLNEALEHGLTAQSEIKPDFSPESKFVVWATLVCILDSLGQTRQADEVSARISDMINREQAYYLDYNFSALEAQRKLATGDKNAANGWLAENKTLLHDNIDFYKLFGHMVTCRAYIAIGEYDTAILLMTKVLALVTSYNRPIDIIEAQTLLATAYWKKGRDFHEEAMRYLKQAVSSAHKYGYTQLFVSCGESLADMMLCLQERQTKQSVMEPDLSDFIKTLCLKLQSQYKRTENKRLSMRTKIYTAKQMTVIRLLCEGKSHREIADDMGIKYSTLRSHISTIYNKLDVANETEAVAKVKALRI